MFSTKDFKEGPQEQSQEGENVCHICLDVVDEDHTLTPCIHLFCSACLQEWIKKQFLSTLKMTCPTCGKNLSTFASESCIEYFRTRLKKALLKRKIPFWQQCQILHVFESYFRNK